LRNVASEIGSHLDGPKPLTVVVRSTVFPGTCVEVVAPAVEPKVAVLADPEFLREGTAVKDFMEPSLVVVGSHNRAAAEGPSVITSKAANDYHFKTGQRE
jgi:GDP-mannose 6-dehydrogenase